jgi:hypothetical protein
MTCPRKREQADEDVYPAYLRQAGALLAGLPDRLPSRPTGLSPDFEALRWFPLPPGCLSQIPGQPTATPTD